MVQEIRYNNNQLNKIIEQLIDRTKYINTPRYSLFISYASCISVINQYMLEQNKNNAILLQLFWHILAFNMIVTSSGQPHQNALFKVRFC